MGRDFDPADTGYVDVASRIVEFREKHPDGCLQPADPANPYRVETIGSDTFVVVVAAAYRTAEDARPGIGMAYEAYPGKTPYTRGSELQNAETSAWGRAIVAALAADTKRGIASADEVRNRQADHDAYRFPQPAPPLGPDSTPSEVRAQIKAAGEAKRLTIAEIADDFHDWSKGEQIGTASTAVLLEYLQHLNAEPAA
jgi:hypothetical protein